jgi:aldos-2-ulose dehydratase/isomerase family protein/VCBS repeat protein
MRVLPLLSTLSLAFAPAVQTPAGPPAASPPVFRFETQEIRDNFGVGYAVTVADVNGDRKPDVLAISGTQLVWFENPSWQAHVVLDGQTPKDNVALAPHDIDRDGRLDVAIGATWKPTDTNAGGTLHWASPGAAGASWTLRDITSEPTLHRIRWANVDGTGDPELIVAPLHGRGTSPPEWNGVGPRVLALRIPQDPVKDPWPAEVIDDTLHIVHNFAVLDFDGDGDDELIAASREGLHLLERGAGGRWTKTRLGDVNAGEVKVGRLGGTRALAVIEPWHGTTVAIYREPAKPTRGPWTRQVIDETLTGGHAIGWADVDGDGSDELVAGWRDKDFGVALYRITSATERPARVMIDAGGMAAEDLTVADLDADGRPDIVASGRRTANVRIYWNRTPR